MVWSARVRVGWVGLLSLCCVACGDDSGASDGGVECTGEADGCSAGEVCVAGRCFAACMDDEQCSRFERCQSGRCVPAMPRDGGGRDAGAIDPCAGVSCMDPTPFCHPLTGTCVQCLGMADCGGSTPICAIATGNCVGFAPRACAPCNSDLDCRIDGTMSFGTCQTLSVTGSDGRRGQERVCVAACTGGACSTGFRCMMDGANCVPVGGCTASLAAIDGRSCTNDDACMPLGVRGDVGQCLLPALVDSGGTDAGAAVGVCRHLCGDAPDCPVGLVCEDMRFCRP